MVELAGLSRLSPFVDPVAERFTEAGHRIFLVGGVVRDLSLGHLPNPASDEANDIDLTTDAHPEVIKRLVAPLAEALWAQGEKFGTIGATVEGQALEITTHRAEAYDPDSRKPIVTFGTDLGEDLSRRDFTINAMAIELPGHLLHDPYDGAGDLAARSLRTPLSPEVSFGDDPLRMLRAGRFIARFSLTATPELSEAARNLADRLSIVSVERVAEELERLLKVDEPAAGLAFYAETGLMDRVIVPYANLSMDRTRLGIGLAGADVSPLLRRLGLLWPLTDNVTDGIADGTADGAADRAADVVSAELHRLRFSKHETLRTARILGATKRLLEADSGPADVRRFVAGANIEDLRLVNDLAALVAAHDGNVAPEHGPRVERLIDQLSRDENLGDLASPLNANEIMETLAIEPGPLVGRAQRFLQGRRLDQGPIAKTDAKEMLLAWMARKQQGF